MSVLTRYLLFQVPGWIAVAIVMGLLHHWLGIAPWIAVAVTFLWAAKDFLLYPWFRSAYEGPARTSALDRLVGAAGVAEEDLAPVGYARVRGELWRARVNPEDGPVRRGERIRVRGVDGALLVVDPERESGPGPGGA